MEPIIAPSIEKDLSNGVYEKRKGAAFQIEALARQQPELVPRIIEELTHLTHGTTAKMGALTAFAGVAVALGPMGIPYYLEQLVKPIFVAFRDTNARVRYYACELLYNISKIARGEILVYFNDVFDILCILVTDPELLVKNAADLLDRLIKDIVCAKAVTFVLALNREGSADAEQVGYKIDLLGRALQVNNTQDTKKAFLLVRFIPTLMEHMYTLDPFARKFLLTWIDLLDDLPLLELITYMPTFFKGLVMFLDDSHQDVRIETHKMLNNFLKEIKSIHQVREHVQRMQEKRSEEKRSEAKRSEEKQSEDRQNEEEKPSRQQSLEPKPTGAPPGTGSPRPVVGRLVSAHHLRQSLHARQPLQPRADTSFQEGVSEQSLASTISPETEGVKVAMPVATLLFSTASHSDLPIAPVSRASTPLAAAISGVLDLLDGAGRMALTENPLAVLDDLLDGEIDDGLFISGQDVYVDYPKIIEILVGFLDSPNLEIQFTVLRWIEELLRISANSFLKFLPRILSLLLPTLSHENYDLRKNAQGVNAQLHELIKSLDKEPEAWSLGAETEGLATTHVAATAPTGAASVAATGSTGSDAKPSAPPATPFTPLPQYSAPALQDPPHLPQMQRDMLNFPATINAVFAQFLAGKDTTRVAALGWLILIHAEYPQEFFESHEVNISDLLQLLVDPLQEVIVNILRLLLQISEGDEKIFSGFIVDLINLFKSDKVNMTSDKYEFILRKLCLTLDSEKIYRTILLALVKETDLGFLTRFVQTLNTILTTAVELQGLRHTLRSLDLGAQSWKVFSTLFKAWCHSPAAALLLCLLTGNYNLAYLIVQRLAEYEVTFTLLSQVDVLVQLLELPVFTKLRLQLLEPDRYPYLYKCLYGLLMVLPQLSTFKLLQNRLSAISSIGNVLHSSPPAPLAVSPPTATLSTTGSQLIQRKRVADMLEWFVLVQALHEAFRQQVALSNQPPPARASAGGFPKPTR